MVPRGQNLVLRRLLEGQAEASRPVSRSAPVASAVYKRRLGRGLNFTGVTEEEIREEGCELSRHLYATPFTPLPARRVS